MAVLELEHEVVNRDVEIPLRPAHPVLLEMAELISKHGWCQGRYEGENGELCVMGAFYELLARNDSWPVDDCWEAPYYYGLHAFERAIAEEVPEFAAGELWDAATWQDMPGRTKFEVIDRLRRVGWLGK